MTDGGEALDGRQVSGHRGGIGPRCGWPSGSRSPTRSRCVVRALYGWDPLVDGEAVLQVALLAVPLTFLGGLGCFDYWLLLGGGPQDAPGGPLEPRRALLARLLQGQHRPQGHRHAVRRDLVLLPVRRRPDRDAHARGARPAGPPVRRRGDVQRPLQRPRVAADLPVHHPGLRRAGELRAAAHDRRAGHGVPAAERAVVLDAARRRPA